jgi:hypothetical protein
LSLRDRTCIAGVGTTAYGTRGQFFGTSQTTQIREALDAALGDAGIDRREIDGFASYSVDANDPRGWPALGIPNVNFSTWSRRRRRRDVRRDRERGGGDRRRAREGRDGLQGHHAAAYARFGAAYGLAQAAIPTPTSTGRSGSCRRRSSSR